MKNPKWFTLEGALRKQNADSKKQEQKTAKRLGGRVQAGSGSSYRAPADVKSEKDLAEVKFTSKHSYSLKVDVWKKIRRQAQLMGKEPQLEIWFKGSNIKLLVTEI